MHACKIKSSKKVEIEKISLHTHNTQDMLSGKPFEEKTQSEGEAVSLFLSLEIWLQIQRSNFCGQWAATVHKSSLCDLPPISSGYLFSTMEQNALKRMECLFLLVSRL